MTKVRWGILGTASIATRRVIPAIQASRFGEVSAIASRDLGRARQVASAVGDVHAHGSYEALLADANVDAVYIPLPNHLHLPWALRAIEAGKHVLCEKPIGMNADEARAIQTAAAAQPRLKVMEAFMYRCHPRWHAVWDAVGHGVIGPVGSVHTTFCYDNRDGGNIRNKVETGGGALMDIGCYGISVARWIFGRQPVAISGKVSLDPVFGTDRFTSGILDFGDGLGTFTSATQLAWYQHVTILGAAGRIDVPIPFNPAAEQPTKIVVHRGEAVEDVVFPPCDHYQVQSDLFSRAILDDTPVLIPLEDAVANMTVIDAIRRGGR